eukprot:g12288.t1
MTEITNDSTQPPPPPPKLYTYNDLPLSAHQQLEEQFKAHDKSTGRLLTFLKSYNEINRAYAQSLKRLATSNLALEEQEDNGNVSDMYSRLRALVKNESVQVLNFVESMNVDVIQPVKSMKEKNGKQHDSAITEINKLLTLFEKDKRSYLANARKTEKAIEARKLAITRQIELEKKIDQKEQQLRFQKLQQQKKLLKQLQNKTGENNDSNDDNGEISIQTPTATIEPTAFPRHPVRKRRGTVTTAKLEQEKAKNNDTSNNSINKLSKQWLPPWMKNKHIVLSEDEVNELKGATEALKMELNKKKMAITQTARSFFMIWQASERRRTVTVNNSLKKACIVSVSRLANTTYDMNQLCKKLEEIEFGKPDSNSKAVDDRNKEALHEKGSSTNSLHQAMDTYFHDFVQQFVEE